MMRKEWLLVAALVIGTGAASLILPRERPAGKLELVATFAGPMPTGVTVSRSGRIFVNFPRWGDAVAYTVAEVKRGKPRAYPPGMGHKADPAASPADLISVQSVVVDPRDRLWILDTGSIAFGPTRVGGPKLVGVDLRTDKVVQTITFPAEVALETSYLNDVRFDLRRGKAGMAFITDSSSTGPNGIVVVDLATGQSWRRLHDHPFTKAVPGFLPIVEGEPLRMRPKAGRAQPLQVGSDGIAIGPDGKWLYFCPLASRTLYRASVDALVDPRMSDDQVGAMVESLGDKGGASDGLEADAQGRVYLTNYEHNAVMRRGPDGEYETLVHDPRLLWPDTLSLATNGYLYITANQLHRQAMFQRGVDRRQKPYSLFRLKVSAQPAQPS